MSSFKVDFLDFRTVKVSMGNKSKTGKVPDCQIAVTGKDNIKPHLYREMVKVIQQLEREHNVVV